MKNQEIKEQIGASWRLVLFHPRFYCGNKKLAASTLAAFRKTPNILISDYDTEFYKELSRVKSVQKITKITSGEN